MYLVLNGEYEIRLRDTVKIINGNPGKIVTLCTIRTCAFVQSPAVWKKDKKESPSFTVMVGVVSRVPSHFTEKIALNGTTRTGFLLARGEAIGPSTRGGSHCSLVRDASHPEADPIGFALLPNAVEIRDESQTSGARQTTALLLDTKNGENRREETGREDCEASRRWSALDLASVRSLAGPSCSPVLICFLLPSRLPSCVTLRRSLPRPSPPRSRKGGFESPPVLAAASCCRCNEKPERVGACGLC